jgi:3'-5' exoribonuclease
MSLPKPLYAVVTEENLRPTRSGERYFYQFTLKTKNGSIKANMWNCTKNSLGDPSFPHKGDIIEITDLKDELESHKSIIINHFKRLEKNSLPEQEKSLCEFPKANPEQLKKALSVLGDKTLYDDVKNYEFVVKCFSKLDKSLLMNCPAASRIHHSVAGGLIIHTAEVMLLCKKIYESCKEDYTFVSNDVLMAGAALHDCGKVRTYYIDDLGMPEQLATEKTLGHMYFGIEIVQAVGRELKMNQKFIDEISHCIAAHHGKVEFGSMKPVQSQEALILHCADLISSRNGMMENKLQEIVKSNSSLPEIFNIYSDPHFASIGMQEYIKKHQG